MNAKQIQENTLQKAHCDWIIAQAQELRALLSYDSTRIIELNRVRATAAINTAHDSLREIQAYIDSITE